MISFGRCLVGAAFVMSWALLLAARVIAAAIYASEPGRSFEVGYHYMGRMLPIAAWAALAVGLFVVRSIFSNANDSAEPSAASSPARSPAPSAPRQGIPEMA